jgi:hypothetical protein
MVNSPVEELQEKNLQDVYTKIQLTDKEFDDWLIAMGLLHVPRNVHFLNKKN